MQIEDYIRTIPDFPNPGIQFRDVTTLFADSRGFQLMLQQLSAAVAGTPFDVIAGIDARGFIVGSALAAKSKCGFVALRKQGKLPAEVDSEPYALEYGTAVLEVHKDSFKPQERVLLVDDLIATGGTAIAGVRLIEKQGAKVVLCAFVVDLPELGGSAKLRDNGYESLSLCRFAGA